MGFYTKILDGITRDELEAELQALEDDDKRLFSVHVSPFLRQPTQEYPRAVQGKANVLVIYEDTGRLLTHAEDRVDVMLSTDGGFEGDGSEPPAAANVTAVGEYTYAPPESRDFIFWRMMVQIKSVSGNIDLSKYGSSLLTLGLLFTVKDSDDVVVHRFNPKPLQEINDWGTLAGPDLPETDRNTVIVRFSVYKGSTPVLVPAGHYLSLEVREVLTGIARQYCQVEGNLR